jgi:ribosomal-protein-alanine N-acetyltransferase
MADPWVRRPATVADAPALAALERRCFSDPWPAGAFTSALEAPQVIAFVVEERGAILGYFVGRAVLGEGEILNLAVVPEARRRGLGRWILEAGLALLREAGADEVFLEVRASNRAARALYRARGFREVGRRARYYRQPVEDALVLRLGPDTPA